MEFPCRLVAVSFMSLVEKILVLSQSKVERGDQVLSCGLISAHVLSKPREESGVW